jgi:hypothetical protein
MTQEQLDYFHDDVSDLPEYQQRARFRPMGIDSTGQLVDRAYRAGLPLQFNRELVKNSIESGATTIKIGPDQIGLQDTNYSVYRYTIADNGCGMTGEELVRFFNKLSSSGKLMDDQGNFGMGAKISLLPWNHAGIVVMSWKGGIGAMVKVVRDPYTQNYALEPWRLDDDDVFADCTDAPEAYKPEWLGENGTVLLCLGNSLDENTYAGPTERDAYSGLSTAKLHRNCLNERFFEFPSGLDVSVWEFSARPQPNEKPLGSFARVFGAKKGLDERAALRGVVDLSDARVWWWLMPDVQTTGAAGENTRSRTGDFAFLDRGFTAAMHDSEMYDALAGEASKHRLHQFGILWPKVRQNIALVVAPSVNEKGKVAAPDTSRRKLIFPGGEDLPWARWGEEFSRKIPEPIKAALRDAAPESTVDRQKIAEKLREFTSRMQFHAMKPSKTGVAPADGSMPGPDPGSTEPCEPDLRENRPKRRRRKGAGYRKDGDENSNNRQVHPQPQIPTAQWLSESEGEFKGRAATFIPSSNLIHINRDFTAIQECLDHWIRVYAPSPGSAKVVKEVVEQIFEQELTSKVYHALAFEGRAAWREQFNFDRLPLQGILSDESLTLAVLGIIHTHQIIATQLGGRFGGAPKSVAAGRK